MSIPAEYINQIVTGDARVLAERIPDASVDLIFTDPVYENIDDYRWLARTANRILKPSGALLCFCGIGYQEETQSALRFGGRPVSWILPIIYSAGNTPRFHQKGFAKWTMLLWAGGEPVEHFCDAQISTFEARVNGHQWTKNMRPLQAYLLAFSQPKAIVFDPFTGGATIPAVCKMLNRDYVAFESDAAIAARARARVEATQAMHPVFLEEQTMMAVA